MILIIWYTMLLGSPIIKKNNQKERYRIYCKTAPNCKNIQGK